MQRYLRFIVLTLVLLAACVSFAAAASKDDAPPAEPPPAEPSAPDAQAQEATQVVLETTKGNIILTVHPDWSPLGAAHFLDLVNDGFYDGAPFFRVIGGFMAQCGISSDPDMNNKWMDETIKDEPLVKGCKRGFVCYGKSSMPDSRSTHFFINYVDNSSMLDPQGFNAFAEVTEGMNIADKLFRLDDQTLQGAGLDQGSLATKGGMDKFKKLFPKATFIKKAYIKQPEDKDADAGGTK